MEILFESMISLMLIGLVFYLRRAGKERIHKEQAGWRYIILGFLFLFFSCISEILEKFPVTYTIYISRDITLNSLLEIFEALIFPLTGYTLLTYGLVRWTPTVSRLLREMTERVQSQEALAESERKFRDIFEHANDSIFRIDFKTMRFLDVNINAAKRLGYSREELLAMGPVDIDGGNDPKFISNIMSHLLDKGHVLFEHTHKKKDGSLIPVEISSRVVEFDGFKEIRSTVRDISKRKQAQEALDHSRRVLAGAQRIARLGSWEVNLDTGVTVWSEDIYDILGMDREIIVPNHQLLLDAIHPDDLDKFLYVCDQTRISPERSFNIDLRLVLPGLEEKIVNSQGEAVLADSGKNIMLVGTLQDITRRKKSEKALMEKTFYLNSILKASKIAIAATDSRFKILYFNPAGEKLFGYKAEDTIGKSIITIHAEEGVDPVRFEKGMSLVRQHSAYAYTISGGNFGKSDIRARISIIPDKEDNVMGYLFMAEEVV